MKSALVALMLLATAPAMACIGGNLKSLNLGERQIGELDFQSDVIRIKDAKSILKSVTWSSPDALQTLEICSETGEIQCTNNQSLSLDLTGSPSSSVEMTIEVDGKDSVFTASGFRVTRSIGGCGGVVEGKPATEANSCADIGTEGLGISVKEVAQISPRPGAAATSRSITAVVWTCRKTTAKDLVATFKNVGPVETVQVSFRPNIGDCRALATRQEVILTGLPYTPGKALVVLNPIEVREIQPVHAR